MSDTVVVALLGLAGAAFTSLMAYLGVRVTSSTRTQTRRVDATVANFDTLQQAYDERGDLVDGLNRDLAVERERRTSLEDELDAEKQRRERVERHMAALELVVRDQERRIKSADDRIAALEAAGRGVT